MMRTVKPGWILMGLVAMLSSGCSAPTATGPSAADAAASSAADATALTTYTPPTVTLRSDLTASPSRVTVKASYRVRFTNQSGRDAQVHSYNCAEFDLMALPAGTARNTLPFKPAGKTCDYFVWDTNWSRKILEGQVVVQ